MLKRIFIDHPRSVDESYFSHMRQALGFGFAMIGAGLACLIHAFVPALFVKTGSKEVARLHTRMVSNRCRSKEAAAEQRALPHG